MESSISMVELLAIIVMVMAIIAKVDTKQAVFIAIIMITRMIIIIKSTVAAIISIAAVLL